MGRRVIIGVAFWTPWVLMSANAGLVRSEEGAKTGTRLGYNGTRETRLE